MNFRRIVMVGILALSLISVSCNKKPTSKLKATAGQHSVSLGWTASPTLGVSYNIRRNGAVVATTAMTTYTDGSLPGSSTFQYQVSAFYVSCPAVPCESDPSNTVSATTLADSPLPPPPPTPSGFNSGDRVKTKLTANVRGTAPASGLGTLLGTVPAGSLGTVGTATQVANSGGWTWVQVKFDSCAAAIPGCTGYVGSDNLTVVTTPPPPPPPPPPTPTLKITCTPLVNGNTCIITTTGIAAGTPYTVVANEGGLNAAATGVSK